ISILPVSRSRWLPAFSFEESFWTEQELFIAPEDEVRAALRDTAFLRLEDETIHIVERSTQRTIGQDAINARHRQQENHQHDSDCHYHLDQSKTAPMSHP